ncbi:MAG: NAD-dependent DNA ligase LigA [Cytophagales bacterium]|nr:MAG: NAD-dependent DNA ligase LigA [Cytophagales bacterium]
MSNIEEAENRIKSLTEQINHHNHLYYQESQSEISDYEFDLLLQELIQLEQQFPSLKKIDSPSNRVGGDITKDFATITHKYPMLSLGNTYTEEELFEFDQRIKKLLEIKYQYVSELKFDGVAISLIYENGYLTHAITRGDGVQGDDVTNNVKTIRSIPLKLKSNDYPSYFEVRGEIFLPFSEFEKINKEKEELGEPLLANPRNTASGTLKMQDSSIVAKRKLECYIYSLLGENLPVQTHSEAMEKLINWGFNVSPTYESHENIESVLNYIKKWETARFNLPLGTDGIVIKVNHYIHQQELGMTAKVPRWAIAFKYKAEHVSTLLESVEYQVGRTGNITPVANLKPVLLAGTTVKRASLHNANEMERLDLHFNDTVWIEKGGEIIPKITSVELSKRIHNASKISFIHQCPACATPLIRKENEANHYCPNELSCPPQIKGKIEHFIHRKAMNIEGIGPETIDQLYDLGIIQNYADLYSLSFPKLLTLERFGEKSANNLLLGLEKSKSVPFKNVLFALGIRFVGATVAEKLAYHFKNLNAIINASYEALCEAPEVGDRIAQSVTDYFKNPHNLKLIEQLKSAGLQFYSEEKTIELEGDKLSGFTFVISGVFQHFEREELKLKIEKNGGKVVSSISAKLNYLLAGENMGPSKLEKASKLGIKIISETEFIAMIG